MMCLLKCLVTCEGHNVILSTDLSILKFESLYNILSLVKVITLYYRTSLSNSIAAIGLVTFFAIIFPLCNNTVPLFNTFPATIDQHCNKLLALLFISCYATFQYLLHFVIKLSHFVITIGPPCKKLPA